VSKKVFNIQGGKHSAAAYSELEKWAYGSCVASATSFVVSAGSGMNLNISTGAGLISDTIARRIGTDATETATVPTASASFNRIDSVVAYIDTAVTPTTGVTDNTNDILKFVVVAGTAAASPVAPNDSAIQSAIGAGKPFMRLYNVTVPQNATNTSGMTFSDQRTVLSAPSIADGIVTTAKLAALSVTSAKIATNAVTGDKLATDAITIGYASTTTTQTGMGSTEVALAGLSVTVNVPTGGRKVELSFVMPNFNSTGGSADQCRVFFKEGATVLSSATDNPSSNFGHLFNGSFTFTPTAGTHTYHLTYQRTNGSGDGATNADVGAVCYFTARLV
jgi:hypothetical protein